MLPDDLRPKAIAHLPNEQDLLTRLQRDIRFDKDAGRLTHAVQSERRPPRVSRVHGDHGVGLGMNCSQSQQKTEAP